MSLIGTSFDYPEHLTFLLLSESISILFYDLQKLNADTTIVGAINHFNKHFCSGMKALERHPSLQKLTSVMTELD